MQGPDHQARFSSGLYRAVNRSGITPKEGGLAP